MHADHRLGGPEQPEHQTAQRGKNDADTGRRHHLDQRRWGELEPELQAAGGLAPDIVDDHPETRLDEDNATSVDDRTAVVAEGVVMRVGEIELVVALPSGEPGARACLP